MVYLKIVTGSLGDSELGNHYCEHPFVQLELASQEILKLEGLVQMIFLFKGVIFRFQLLIFGNVVAIITNHEPPKAWKIEVLDLKTSLFSIETSQNVGFGAHGRYTPLTSTGATSRDINPHALFVPPRGRAMLRFARPAGCVPVRLVRNPTWHLDRERTIDGSEIRLASW